MVASVTIAFANGAHVAYDGVFVYEVDDNERIATVRSYFDLANAGYAGLVEPDGDGG